jgi:hypothetical protein
MPDSSQPNPAALAASRTTHQPLETVRLLRASVRCLALGVTGLVPVLGAGLAMGALQLGGELMQRTGEAWDWKPLSRWSLLGVGLLWYAHERAGLVGVFPVWVLAQAALAAWLHRRYRLGTPLEFNAARRQVYWGIGCALSGLVTSVVTLAVVAANAVNFRL